MPQCCQSCLKRLYSERRRSSANPACYSTHFNMIRQVSHAHTHLKRHLPDFSPKVTSLFEKTPRADSRSSSWVSNLRSLPRPDAYFRRVGKHSVTSPSSNLGFPTRAPV